MSTVLLVEDDALLRDAFRMVLDEAGYDVLEAETAEGAIETARRQPPGVIFLDLGLPDRPGLDVVRTLRSEPAMADTPIFALTGRGGTEERAACEEAGCTGYLEKPIRPTVLLQHVRRILG